MKSFILTLIVFVLGTQYLKSQDSLRPAQVPDTTGKPVFYTAYVYHLHKVWGKGYLVTITDSSLFISQDKIPLSFVKTDLSGTQRFDYPSLTKVKIVKPHVRGRSILIGIAAGAVLGALIGYAGGDDTGWFAMTAGEKAFVGGLLGGGAGCLVGAIVGSGSVKKYLINGEWKSLQEMKASLQTIK